MTELDWDGWRTAYPSMTYQEQQDFHSLVYEQFPVQRHYSSDYVARAIEDALPTTVVELGGWDGELAGEMLDRYPTIRSWRNVELCKEAAEAGVGRHPRYEAVPMQDWYWSRAWDCDLFVASHVIEHLTVHDLEQTIAATRARAMFMDAPLEDKATMWQGSTTTHTLHTGWIGVNQICARYGYLPTWAETHETGPHSGDRARAVLYTHRGAQ